MSKIRAFDHIENKHTLSRGIVCMKKFCTFLREHGENITDFEKKKMLLLTKEALKSYQDAKACYICGKRFLKKLSKSINDRKVRDPHHYTGKCRGPAQSTCNLKLNVLNEISVVFHNGSNYDYHFITKELANESDGQFEWLG